MADIVKYTLSSGASVLVQTPEGKKATAGPAGRGVQLEDAEQTFEEATEHIKSLVESLLTRLTASEVRPDKINVEFGIAFGAKAGVILTSGSVDANLKISLAWEK